MLSDDDSRNRGHLGSAIRSQDLWFDDGSVILHAQNTQFRVHRSVLSTHSQVFRDMFSVPQPENEPTIEGCPVVYLADNKKDWEVVLNLLYNVWNMPQTLHEYDVPVLISMLRIGHKYQCDNLKKAAYGRLELELPTDSAQWDDSPLSLGRADIKAEHEQFIKGYEIDLINIAIEIDMLKFLPVLYYLALKNLEMTDILDGTIRKDGTVAQLSRETQRVLIIARDGILSCTRRYTLSWLFGYPIATFDEDHCSQCNLKRAKNLVLVAPLLIWDVSLALQDPPDFVTAGMCDGCVELAERDMSVGRHRLWDKLPMYFDLPDWDTLLTEEG